MKTKMLLSMLSLLLAACIAQPVAVVPATSQERAVLFDQIKPMEGAWNYYDARGKWQGTGHFALTSGGSALREIMFNDSPHEMTNLYHMDGGTLVMTHYCASGNQPRLRIRPDQVTKPGEFDFKFDSITNWTSTQDNYMGRMKLAIVDKDHASQTWTSYQSGKASTETFTLKRQPVVAKTEETSEAKPAAQ